MFQLDGVLVIGVDGSKCRPTWADNIGDYQLVQGAREVSVYTA